MRPKRSILIATLSVALNNAVIAALTLILFDGALKDGEPSKGATVPPILAAADAVYDAAHGDLGVEVSTRIASSFNGLAAVPHSFEMREVVWRVAKGQALVTEHCGQDAFPHIGCNDMASAPPRAVQTESVDTSLLSPTSLKLAASQLQGTWQSAGYTISVDSERTQANMDPSTPFEWKRFLIKRVTEDEVTFAVGTEIYKARLASNSITLTSTSFRGERILSLQAR